MDREREKDEIPQMPDATPAQVKYMLSGRKEKRSWEKCFERPLI